MNQKKFFYMFLGVFIGLILLIAPLNYIIDYRGVFRGANHEIAVYRDMNDRFVKLKYLLFKGDISKYDSYILGSSRVMKMNSRITGLQTYNLGAGFSTPYDGLNQIKCLLMHNAPIEYIFWGIEDFSTYMRTNPSNDLVYQLFMEDNPWNWLQFYGTTLFNPETIGFAINDERKALLGRNPQGNTMLYTTGTYFVPMKVEDSIEQSPERYVLLDKFKEPFHYPGQEGTFIDETIKDIKELKGLCEVYDIKLIIFFQPIHMTTYLNEDIAILNTFKKELVKISPFWDFSGVNYVTTNNYFWYETLHPRAFICDKILDTVSGQNQITWVPDFGVYVTPDNVDTFCENAVHDREAYDPNHEQWVPSAEERAVLTRRINDLDKLD